MAKVERVLIRKILLGQSVFTGKSIYHDIMVAGGSGVSGSVYEFMDGFSIYIYFFR